MVKSKEATKKSRKQPTGEGRKRSVSVDSSVRGAGTREARNGTDTQTRRTSDRFPSSTTEDQKPVAGKGLVKSTSLANDLQDEERELALKEFFASDEELDFIGAMSLDMYQDQQSVILRAAGVQEYLSFSLDDEIFAVNIFHIKEIIKPPAITEVPRTESVILGILSLRGTIAPVVDLRRRLGLKAGPTKRSTRILIVFLEDELIGMLVDEVRHVIRLRDEDIEPPPGVFDRIEAEHILGVGRQHGEMYTLLDLNFVVQVDKFIKAS